MANSAHGGNGARNVPAPAPTTYDDGVQVRALALHQSAEDPLRHAVAAWGRQRVVDQLHRHSPHGLPSVVG
jgi:hypothetical protein